MTPVIFFQLSLSLLETRYILLVLVNISLQHNVTYCMSPEQEWCGNLPNGKPVLVTTV